MQEFGRARVLVAHHRAPVQRMLCTTLRADGFAVMGVASPGACLNALRSFAVAALILDAELLKGERRSSADLFRYLISGGVPTLVVSWDPDDWRLARSLRDAPFLSRPDDVDQLLGSVRVLVARPAPAAR
jgi:DNA-binding response OmpR family regulator